MVIEPERFTLRATTFLILEKEGKILLYKRKNTSYENGNYGFVGGHLDGNETVYQGIIREAKEEVGIDIDEKDLRVVHLQQANFGEGVGEYFVTYLKASAWRGEPQNMEPDRCEELAWFDRNKLPSNTISGVSDVLSDIENGIFFSTQGF